MTKKTLITISLLLVCLCIFACCKAEDFKFEALSTETMPGELVSNGGVSVSYKGYTYFINGDTGSYSGDNTFGKVTYGAICRIKTAHLTDDSFKDLVMGTDDYAAVSSAKVQILAPKAFFNNNTSSATLNGLYIFGERLYYTTPSTTVDKNGVVQNTYLDIMSVKLDGTDTKRMYTLDSNAYELMLGQNANNVYACYLNRDSETNESKLYSVNLMDKKPSATMIAEHIGYYVFDIQNGLIALTQNIIVKNEIQDTETMLGYNTVNVFKAGDTAMSVVVTGKPSDQQDASDGATFIVQRVNADYIYFYISADNHGRDGCYRIGVSERDKTFATLSALTTTTYKKLSTQNYLEKGILTSDNNSIYFYNDTEKYLSVYNINTGRVSNVMYMTMAPTLTGVVGTKLYYVTTNLSYIDLSSTNPEEVQLSSRLNSPAWTSYDLYEDYVLFLTATDASDVYLCCAETVSKDEDIKESFVGIYTKDNNASTTD